MNEWDFTSLAAGWMNAAIEADQNLPFSAARCEMKGRGSNKRRDLTLLGKDGSPVITGEVKLPFQPEGSSPFRSAVVLDAREKAERAKVQFFFTWNVNRLALWPTKLSKGEAHNAAYREWTITDIHREPQLDLQANQEVIQRWIPLFLREIAEVSRGDKPIDRKPPDLRFIETIEAELEQPILQTTDTLAQLITKQKPRNELQRWMREDQGWILAAEDDKQGTLADLNRAAQFANYALLNKVVFHEALLKRYGSELKRLDVPDHIDTGERLRLHFEGHFATARRVTGDYETVFGKSRRAVATFEASVKSLKGTAHRIDVFWPSRLIGEHKSRCSDLTKAHARNDQLAHILLALAPTPVYS